MRFLKADVRLVVVVCRGGHFPIIHDQAVDAITRAGACSALARRATISSCMSKIGEGLIEPLGPEVIAGFGVDELHINAQAIAAALNAALKDIADVQLTSDRLHVERLAFVSESRVTGDDVSAPYP
jgi:hypothetical protein